MDAMNSQIILHCLVEGDDPAKHTLTIPLDARDTIDTLKVCIHKIHKRRKEVFSGVDASSLELWKTEIAFGNESTIVFQNDANNEPQLIVQSELLDSRYDIGDYWTNPPPRKHYHVICKRPSDGPPVKKRENLATLLLGQNLRQVDEKSFPHNFYDRTEAIEKIARIARNNFAKRGSADQKDHSMIFIPGGKGIGKTRMGWEVKHLAKDERNLDNTLSTLGSNEKKEFWRAFNNNPCYIYINLGNDLSYNKKLDGHTADVRIGARVAVAAGLTTMAELMQYYPIHTFGLKDVIQEILKRRYPGGLSENSPKVIIIHIDEYQVYIDHLVSSGEDLNDARRYFKEMLQEIGIIMQSDKKFFIIPISTGTSTIDIHFIPSSFPSNMILLKPLNYKAAMNMFRDKFDYSRQKDEEAKSQIEVTLKQLHLTYFRPDQISRYSTKLCDLVQNQNHFQIALHDTGFIPKFIDYLLIYKELKLDNDWGTTLYTEMSNMVIEIKDAPSHWRNEEDIRVVICFGLTGQMVSRDFILPSGYSIGSIERDGLIYLSQTSNPAEYIIILPFMLLKILNRKLEYTKEGCVIPDDLLLLPTYKRPWLWQDFENLHGYFQRLIINALLTVRNARVFAIESFYSSHKKILQSYSDPLQIVILESKIQKIEEALEEEKTKNFQLSDLFPGAIGSEILLEREIILNYSRNVYTEKQKFLIETTDTAEFNQTVLCDDGNTRDLNKGIFHCADGCANIDYRWAIESCPKPLALFMQDKHSKIQTNSDTFSGPYLKTWYDVTLESVKNYKEDYDIILVFFTNCRYTGSDLSEMPQLLLIDQTSLTKYLSPTFAHRGLVRISDNYEPENVPDFSFIEEAATHLRTEGIQVDDHYMKGVNPMYPH